MLTLEARNVNQAYPKLMMIVNNHGVEEQSRNGRVKALQEPMALTILRPRERVLFDPTRNANPFFHLMEGLWMLAGRNDVEFVKQFNVGMAEYSDDGMVFNAAYGYRWRQHFGYDQVGVAVDMLREDPSTRRCVISMWDPSVDLDSKSKDIPCNLLIMPRVIYGALDFLIVNRSNDLVWGLMGANAVHLTMLQEYMAARLHLTVGRWHHVTDNLHVYEPHFPLMHRCKDLHMLDAKYMMYPSSMPMVQDCVQFEADCGDLCNGKTKGFGEPFFQGTVTPVLSAWSSHKAGNINLAIDDCGEIEAGDWRRACTAWMERAKARRKTA